MKYTLGRGTWKRLVEKFNAKVRILVAGCSEVPLLHASWCWQSKKGQEGPCNPYFCRCQERYRSGILDQEPTAFSDHLKKLGDWTLDKRAAKAEAKLSGVRAMKKLRAATWAAGGKAKFEEKKQREVCRNKHSSFSARYVMIARVADVYLIFMLLAGRVGVHREGHGDTGRGEAGQGVQSRGSPSSTENIWGANATTPPSDLGFAYHAQLGITHGIQKAPASKEMTPPGINCKYHILEILATKIALEMLHLNALLFAG